MNTTRAISSVGALSAMLQHSPQEITAAAQAAGIDPALRINNVNHYDEADVAKIREHLNRIDGLDAQDCNFNSEGSA